jgi:hypothetical protein
MLGCAQLHTVPFAIGIVYEREVIKFRARDITTYKQPSFD